ncbi:MAG TPA: D-glycerate dehydrogenase, partial [Dehalococcoidia bacterium]|nr:D-glycerate dehydrogenase [Dehalococcoidia bacterium]
MAKISVYVTRRLPEPALARLRQTVDLRLWEGDEPVPRHVLLREVAGVEGLLSLLTERVDEELLATAPRLRIISNMAVGYDNVDLAACRRRGLPVGYTPGV